MATLLLRGHLAISGTFMVVTVEWGEARGAVKHLIMHSTAPPTKSYATQNVNSAKTEESWFVSADMQLFRVR